MKKIITLLFACLLMTRVFAGDGVHSYWHNLTQNTGAGEDGFQPYFLTANTGDSIHFFASATCGSGYYAASEQWYFNGDSIPNTTGMVDIDVIINQSGNYFATFDFCGYFPTSINFYVTVNNTTGIESFKNINFLNVYPTAVTSSVTIQLNSIKTNDVEISFYDMNGRQLKSDFYKNIIGEFIKNENTEALAKGIYFLRIKAGDDVVEKKFVKT